MKFFVLWQQRHDVWHWYAILESFPEAIKSTLENAPRHCCFIADLQKWVFTSQLNEYQNENQTKKHS